MVVNDSDSEFSMEDLKEALRDESQESFQAPGKARKTTTFIEKATTPLVPKKKSVAAKSMQSEVKTEVIQDQEDVQLGGGFTSVEDIKDALPEFLKD